MAKKLSLLLLGAGNMGGALLESWIRNGIVDPKRSAVVDPNPSDKILAVCEDGHVPVNPVDDGEGYDYCVLAIKPQMFGDILPTLKWPGIEKTVFMSIAAGVTIDSMTKLLKSQSSSPKIIRTMPNLPAAIGQGMTILTEGPGVTSEQRDDADMLFKGAGDTVWAKDEDQLDRLMGISGCGPAYVFLFAEALEEAALAEGASPEDARKLAEMTVTGSAAHLAQDGRTAAELRKAVTSPGGTTAAALSVWDDTDGLRPLAKRAVRAAYDRAKELGK
ncbi:pyrroline-5-carboxylate reductase [Parvularcula sp. LCG005]|uniref:pyrroline-5-carboxylate reductase n=1 Tax=Parvularcula sp. LCG005 TaxID=3078805 RepID=UPI0029423C3F|nr:pyrroline-5-carboxylate reductase [Parvularcula sp. LCG005]WOI54638.1 pyrroline-5-carboxylate reductase [Parvularcula sp. LCG005]